MALTKVQRRDRIRKRIRKVVTGVPTRPRLSVFRSNKQISAQVIDDVAGVTLVAVTSLTKEMAELGKMTKIEQARLVGKMIAEKCVQKGIQEVTFDRGGYLYHGRVKAVADGARENGLKL